MLIERPRAYGHSVFCDDIRHETSGKLTLVGVYTNAMFVHGEFPFTLPKFGISITYSERHGTCSGPVFFRVFLPGDPDSRHSMEAAVPQMDELRQRALAELKKMDVRPEEKFLQLHTQILQQIVLKEPGSIRVRAMCGSDEVRLGSLNVVHRPRAQEITKIEAMKEVEPAIFEVTLVRADGSKETTRMNVFQLQELRQTLGLPPLPS
jgi:hypothetical protein